MSFRYYLGEIDKKDYEKIKDFDNIELLKEYFEKNDIVDEEIDISDFVYAGDFLHPFYITQISDLSFKLKSENQDFFLNKNLNKVFNSNEKVLFKIEEKDLEKLIQIYKDETGRYYQKLIKRIDKYKEEYGLKEALIEALSNLNNKEVLWHRTYPPIDTDKNSSLVSNGDSYEYAIFDIITVYKNTDFNNKILFIYGF